MYNKLLKMFKSDLISGPEERSCCTFNCNDVGGHASARQGLVVVVKTVHHLKAIRIQQRSSRLLLCSDEVLGGVSGIGLCGVSTYDGCP